MDVGYKHYAIPVNNEENTTLEVLNDKINNNNNK